LCDFGVSLKNGLEMFPGVEYTLGDVEVFCCEVSKKFKVILPFPSCIKDGDVDI